MIYMPILNTCLHHNTAHESIATLALLNTIQPSVQRPLYAPPAFGYLDISPVMCNLQLCYLKIPV